MCPRYDGVADFYEAAFAHYADLGQGTSSAAILACLLGPGGGWCLDVACGTGLHFEAVAATGRRVIGVDISSDQLRIARSRSGQLVRADACRLPFPDAAFETVVCTYLHTDIDEMAPVFGEIARVLQPAGRFVYLGVHPCFGGHFVELLPGGLRLIHRGYWESGWHLDSPYWGRDGLRRRVGVRHVTVAELIGALLAGGLRLSSIAEPDSGTAHAERLALVATRD